MWRVSHIDTDICFPKRNILPPLRGWYVFRISCGARVDWFGTPNIETSSLICTLYSQTINSWVWILRITCSYINWKTERESYLECCVANRDLNSKVSTPFYKFLQGFASPTFFLALQRNKKRERGENLRFFRFLNVLQIRKSEWILPV